MEETSIKKRKRQPAPKRHHMGVLLYQENYEYVQALSGYCGYRSMNSLINAIILEHRRDRKGLTQEEEATKKAIALMEG